MGRIVFPESGRRPELALGGFGENVFEGGLERVGGFIEAGEIFDGIDVGKIDAVVGGEGLGFLEEGFGLGCDGVELGVGDEGGDGWDAGDGWDYGKSWD